MHLFAGAALALRNPRAHALLQDTPEDAVGYLGFLSLLAQRLDRGTRVRDPQRPLDFLALYAEAA